MSNYTKSTNFATKDNLTPGDPLKIVRGTEIDTEYNNIATAIATKTDNASAAITGGSITGITDLAVADGGTGASTAAGALNNLLPSQTGNANKYLQTDGTNATWDAVSLSTADITGTLPVANGGTGVTASTGTGSVVLSNSPTLVTPALGTPSALVGTNITGTASGLTAGNVTTNANLTGAVTSVGNATSLGSFTSANLLGALTDETGTGSAVFATSPTLVTPILGTPTSATLTNATGLPIATGVSGLGTGVATFLATPSSANLAAALTDETGTGSAVFATSPTLVTPTLGVATATSLQGIIGNVTPAAGSFTTVDASGNLTLSGGTANGVTYLNGSKVLTSGSALTFDGTNLLIGSPVFPSSGRIQLKQVNDSTKQKGLLIEASGDDSILAIGYDGSAFTFNPTYNTTGAYKPMAWWVSGSEGMRLTSTGLGIGTSSPEANAKLTVYGAGIAVSRDASTVAPSGFDFKCRSANPKIGIHVTNTAQVAQLEFGTAGDNSFGALINTTGADPLRFGTNNTERARIDSSGNLLVGTTSASAGNTFGSGVLARSTSKPLAAVCDASSGSSSVGIGRTTSTGNYVEFYYGTALTTSTGTISTNGTTTAYNTTSDQRLKENIQDADSASSLIDSLQVRQFDWKADGSHQRYGFVAQELVTVAPEAVHQPEDTEQMMAVDYSKLVPMLVKEIQSLRQRLSAANL